MVTSTELQDIPGTYTSVVQDGLEKQHKDVNFSDNGTRRIHMNTYMGGVCPAYSY